MASTPLSKANVAPFLLRSGNSLISQHLSEFENRSANRNNGENKTGTGTAFTRHGLFNPDTLSSAVGVDALLIPVVVSQAWTALFSLSPKMKKEP